jgi:arsenate reductase-like glutaredoxin family protein
MVRKLSIDWYWQRAGCTACAKAKEFLSEYELDVRQTLDARRTRIGPSGVAAVVEDAKTVLVSDGRSVRRYDVAKRQHDRSDMLARMVGPTGNLRAPTIRRNGLVVVGYHVDSMKELVK